MAKHYFRIDTPQMTQKNHSTISAGKVRNINFNQDNIAFFTKPRSINPIDFQNLLKPQTPTASDVRESIQKNIGNIVLRSLKVISKNDLDASQSNAGIYTYIEYDDTDESFTIKYLDESLQVSNPQESNLCKTVLKAYSELILVNTLKAKILDHKDLCDPLTISQLESWDLTRPENISDCLNVCYRFIQESIEKCNSVTPDSMKALIKDLCHALPTEKLHTICSKASLSQKISQEGRKLVTDLLPKEGKIFSVNDQDLLFKRIPVDNRNDSEAENQTFNNNFYSL